MKKIISLLLVVGLVLSSATLTFTNENEISVYVEGQKVSFDVPPQTINDRTMVPIRAIFEVMGATVNWDNATQTAICTKDNTVVKMTLDSKTEYINDVPYEMDVAPVIVDNRTLAPARYVAEAFGYFVNWDGNTKSVLINKTSTIKDGTKENPYEFGDKVSITFWDAYDFEATKAAGKYEFTLNKLMSPKDMEIKFNDSSYSYDSNRWYLNGNIVLNDYINDGVCSFQDMMYDSKVVASNMVPCEYYSWYIDPSSYRFVELYKGGNTECYIPVQIDEIAEGQSADYFTITFYDSKDTTKTIWFSLK
jgi:hypothetical protein